MCVDDLRDGVEGELFPWDADEFRDYESSGGEHCSTSVLELSLAVPRKPLRGPLLIYS